MLQVASDALVVVFVVVVRSLFAGVAFIEVASAVLVVIGLAKAFLHLGGFGVGLLAVALLHVGHAGAVVALTLLEGSALVAVRWQLEADVPLAILFQPHRMGFLASDDEVYLS